VVLHIRQHFTANHIYQFRVASPTFNYVTENKPKTRCMVTSECEDVATYFTLRRHCLKYQTATPVNYFDINNNFDICVMNY